MEERFRSLGEAERLEDSKIYVDFGTPSEKCKVLVENVAISRGATKNNHKKSKIGSFGKQNPEESNILCFSPFLVPRLGNARCWWKMLLFPEEVPKQ